MGFSQAHAERNRNWNIWKNKQQKRGFWPRTKQQPGGGGGDSANRALLFQNGFSLTSVCGLVMRFFSEMYQFCFGFSVYFTSEWKRSNPLIVKMCGPLEEFHKAAHLWLNLHKRFEVLWLELNISHGINSMKMKASKNSLLLTLGRLCSLHLKKKKDFKRRGDKCIL